MSDSTTLATWAEHPYTSHDKRHITVEHRVRVVQYDGGFADVRHERRSDRDGEGRWKEVAVVELRDHGLTHRKVRGGVFEE